MSNLPNWANEVIASYASKSAGCFLLHGNVNDRHLVTAQQSTSKLGNLTDFILETLVPRFDVVITFDIGTGLKIQKGEDIVSTWKGYSLLIPDKPLDACRFVSQYMLYGRNLRAVNQKAPKVVFIMKQAHLACPAMPNLHSYELNSLVSLIRSWADEGLLQESNQAAFLISDNLNGIHPLISECPRVSCVELPLPDEISITQALTELAKSCPNAMQNFKDDPSIISNRLTGTTLSSLESLLKRLEHDGKVLDDNRLAGMKKALVERDCDGLIDFVEPDRNLDDCIGLDGVKKWLREDIVLWRKNELQALPMGYLFCGPVGTGKTFLAECLAGEAGVPVVTMRNFRDKWIGSTEANLEKIFSLIHALGRCIVFVDEADQALGQREGGSGDSGVSSRVYSMMAKEMSNTRNRGKILWVLASSRPDLIEVDLKRPGRVDVKIPLFPTLNPLEGFVLIRALCKRRNLDIPENSFESLKDIIPILLTPGAAEAISVQTFRVHKTTDKDALESLKSCLIDYRPPVPIETLKFQMRIAVQEATDASLIPEELGDLLDH
jgi:hypothetical protein